MKLFKYIFCLGFAVAPLSSFSQDIKDMPSVAYVYPAGTRLGSTAEFIIGGKKFEDIEKVVVSGEGVEVSLIESILPDEKNRGVNLRNKLQGLLVSRKLIKPEEVGNSKVMNNVDLSEHPDLIEMREKINYESKLYRITTSTQAAFAHTLKVQIKVDKNAKEGKRTIKVIGKSGISNSLPFYIDNLPEFKERSIREKSYAIVFNDEKGIFANDVLKSEQAKLYAKQEAIIRDVQLPVIINGQVDLLQTDIYRFKATKGQEIVAYVKARELIYYIGDGVPGWFQAAISIKDSDGKEIAYVDDFYQNPDPLLAFTAPKTDEYTLEIKDAIYRGREDFVYRILLGEVPFITRIYPLGGASTKSKALNIYGFNLDRKQSVIKQSLRASYNELSIAEKDEKQAKLLYQVSNLKELDFSNKNNISKSSAEELSLYSSINSILKNSGDKHFYEFHTNKDKRVILEVFARRLGSPIDTYLSLYDSAMNLIASNDDLEDFSDGLNTHHADSKIDFNAKANDIYYIVLADAQNKAGQEYAYRLNIYEPKPFFEAKASPSNINIIQGKSTPFNIAVFRKNDDKFPIEVRLKKAPKGLTLSGGEIDENSENVMAVLTCDKDISLGLHEIELEAFTKSNGKKILRDVIPCEDMLQAFYYPHLVPTESLNIYVISPSVKKEYKDVDNIKSIEGKGFVLPEEIDIKLGGEKKINIGFYGKEEKKKDPKKDAKKDAKKVDNKVAITASLRDSSAGITIENIEDDKYGCTITLKSDEKICKVGQSANLIIDVYMVKGDPKKSKKVKIDTLKAIKYIITD